MFSRLSQLVKVVLLATLLVLPSMGWSNTVEETPSAVAMTGDAIFVRPVMIATTLVGGAIFIVSSPFSALGGNLGEAFDELVAKPFETAFIRCLGCTQLGRKADTVTQDDTAK